MTQRDTEDRRRRTPGTPHPDSAEAMGFATPDLATRVDTLEAMLSQFALPSRADLEDMLTILSQDLRKAEEAQKTTAAELHVLRRRFGAHLNHYHGVQASEAGLKGTT